MFRHNCTQFLVRHFFVHRHELPLPAETIKDQSSLRDVTYLALEF